MAASHTFLFLMGPDLGIFRKKNVEGARLNASLA